MRKPLKLTNRISKIVALALVWLSVFPACAQKREQWYQVGFKVSSDIPLNRDYAADIELATLLNIHFNGFFRAGKYVFGEIGFGYRFFRGTYTFNDNLQPLLESRHLTVPIKVVGEVKIGRSVSFLPNAGIIYQPLIGIAGDKINFSKDMLENHWTQLTAGFDMRFGFITLGADYRYSFQKFFRNRGGNNPHFINICLGAIF